MENTNFMLKLERLVLDYWNIVINITMNQIISMMKLLHRSLQEKGNETQSIDKVCRVSKINYIYIKNTMPNILLDQQNVLEV